MGRKKAIIVGAGIAGIATAIRLAVKGYDVTVFDKNKSAGGKMTLIEKEGFLFDAGPSLFTQPFNLEELFTYANEPIKDYFNYIPVSVACKYFFENGISINAHTNANDFAKEMHEKTGEDPQNIIRYLKDSALIYDKVGNIFLNYSLHKFSTWFHPRILKAFKAIRLPYLTNTLNKFNKAKFKTKEAVQIFNRFATYNGSNPFKAPGMLSVIPHLEHNEGTYYPLGGMINIPKAMIRLAEKKGVKFQLGVSVDKIIVEEKKVKGILINGILHEADIVVSNADVYYTYKNLLDDKIGAQKILRNERSSSALIFYWGINKVLPTLHLHNIFFSNNYKEEFSYIFEKKKFYEDPTVYVNITAKMEPGQAPKWKRKLVCDGECTGSARC